MVSEQNGTNLQSHCQWNKCPKSSNPYNTIEQLLDHVLEAHIPTTIKNEDDEDEVICEWEGCQMGTTRGSIEKKTEWMQVHIKTRHITTAKTFKCLFDACDVSKATSRELESHVRTVHLVKPKRVKAPAPEPEPAPSNRIWYVVNGRVFWKTPPKVTHRTIVEYEDGPRYVYPRGHERDSETDYDVFSDEDQYEHAPPRKYAKPGEKGPRIRPDAKVLKKKNAEKIKEERKAAIKAMLAESKNQKEESRATQSKPEIVKPEMVKPDVVKAKVVKPEVAKPKVTKPEMPAARRDINDNIIIDDDFDKMPSLKAYFEDSDSEEIMMQLQEPQAMKPLKKVSFNDKPKTAPISPVKTVKTTVTENAAPVKKATPKIDKPVVLVSKPTRSFNIKEETPKKASNPPKPVSTPSPVKIKKVVEIQKKQLPIIKSSSPQKQTPKSTKSVETARKLTPVPKKPSLISKKRKLGLAKRPSRACRVLGSMEEVPFEMDIEVEFEKPKKLLKMC